MLFGIGGIAGGAGEPCAWAGIRASHTNSPGKRAGVVCHARRALGLARFGHGGRGRSAGLVGRFALAYARGPTAHAGYGNDTDLRTAISRLTPSPSDTALHKTRIKTKRSRYAAELARSSVGKPASRFIKSARAVQGLLGLHQDAIQAERHVRQFLKYSTSVRAGFVAGRMVERQRQRCRNVRTEIKPLFKSLLKRGKKAWG